MNDRPKASVLGKELHELAKKQQDEIIGLAVRLNQLIKPGAAIRVLIPTGRIITSSPQMAVIQISKPTDYAEFQLKPRGG